MGKIKYPPILPGQQYGRLTVWYQFVRLSPAGIRNRRYSFCVCLCGAFAVANDNDLRTGDSQSCGCLWKEMLGQSRVSHGATRNGKFTPEYVSWAQIKSRTLNKKHIRYHLWGGRGVTICERWRHSFANFLADMGPKPSSKHTIERKNNSLGYFPENCIWATPREQANNTRRNHFLTHNGRTLTMAQWARELGIIYSTLRYRINKLKWSEERALTTPRG